MVPERIHRLILRISKPGVLGGLALVVLPMVLALNLLDLPYSVPRIRHISGGADILDVKLFYTADQAYALLAAYGPTGRHVYLWGLATVDMVLPLLYSVLLAVALTLALRPILRPSSPLRLLNLLPLLAGLCDYLENAAILTLLAHYPQRLDGLAGAAGFLTLGKQVFAFSSIVLTLLAWVVAVLRRRPRA